MAEEAVGGQVAAPTDVHVTGRRVLATIVDGVVLSVIFWLFSALFGTTSVEGAGVSASVDGVAALGAFVLAFAYFSLMEGYLGQTLGKMLFGIKVVREDTGEVPGLGAASIRTVLRIIDGLFAYLVAFVTVLASQKNQRLGDMAAHTHVVRK
ncbi:MAG: RDD family protein [Rubrobacter sp.]